MVDCGALDALVICLEEFDPGVKESAAWALGYIARHNAGTLLYYTCTMFFQKSVFLPRMYNTLPSSIIACKYALFTILYVYFYLNSLRWFKLQLSGCLRYNHIAFWIIMSEKTTEILAIRLRQGDCGQKYKTSLTPNQISFSKKNETTMLDLLFL